MPLKNNMPTIPIHDLLIHPRENDLVVGTYGWGIYVTDISPLQELNKKVAAEVVHLFEIEAKIQWRYTWRGGLFGNRHFNVPNETYGLAIYYYLKNAVKEDVKIIITDPYGKELNSLKGTQKAGLHKVVWNTQRKLTEEEIKRIQERGGRISSRSGQPVPPGEYVVILQVGGKKLSQKVRVRPIPDEE